MTDSSGALLPGVEVVVTDQDTGTVRRAITNDTGLYVVQSLKPGTYSISASLAGFKTAVVKDRQVQVTIPAQVNLVMQVGELSETVTVSGVGEEMVNKTTAQLATTISENLVKNLPVETRNYFDLVALAPNTSPEYLSGAHVLRAALHETGQCGLKFRVVGRVRCRGTGLVFVCFDRRGESPDRQLQPDRHDPVGFHNQRAEARDRQRQCGVRQRVQRGQRDHEERHERFSRRGFLAASKRQP